MAEVQQQNLAVQIDADNVSHSLVEPLFAEIAKYGVASVKRIYGDWTSQRLAGWKQVLLSHAIQPIQQFGYTRGKNATDTAMIIDAMDLLYSNRFQGFCLVSSDSDFTRLASRLRESGLTVYGFGQEKTPESFVSACDKFIYLEILQPGTGKEKGDGKSAESEGGPDLSRNEKLRQMLLQALDAVADEDGWAQLGNVGQQISNQQPSFDPRNYGHVKLGELVRAADVFEIEERPVSGDARQKIIYVRRKPAARRRSRRKKQAKPA